jgi:hypothetical protein
MVIDQIEGALAQAAEAMNDFVESFEFHKVGDVGDGREINGNSGPYYDVEVDGHNYRVFTDENGGTCGVRDMDNGGRFLDESEASKIGLCMERGSGFYASDPWRAGESIKVDDIDGQYRAGKITETVTNLTQTSMAVEQADKGAKKMVERAMG